MSPSAALDGYAIPGPGIAAGNSLAGFAVQFDWLGTGTPGSQDFLIYRDLGPSCNPETSDCFPVLATGTTSIVPVPAALWLFGSSLAALGLARRRGAHA